MPATTSRATVRLAVVNRGEPAMRLINAVREWNAEAGAGPHLVTIAVHTVADRHAMFVREADEAVLIGTDDPDDSFGANPYLDLAELERALVACRAEAVWPGWGFVSERADFAALCERLGIIFVGPSSEVMARLGDKIESKRIAEGAGVPMAPWSGGPVADAAAAREQGDKIGYPLMVKATAGGGGRGIRLVTSPDDLDEAFAAASREGERTAGDATVFLEGAIRGGRHVEVQVLADAAGTVWTLGVRDCSVQRRNQKVIEESASTALDDEQDARLRRAAADLVRAAGYVNAGTVEFLYDPRERVLSFMEVNTRLQVEHPVTEVTTGIDIVKLQLRVALGGTLGDGPSSPAELGHAIEARLTAEDPERGFAPAPGRIQHLVLPTGPGIRVDTGVAVGDTIPPQYDSMIAKVIAWGRNREEARARLARAIRQTAVVIDGGTTNKAFLLDLLDRDELVSGALDTSWLDTMMAQGYTPPRRVDVALLAAAVEAHDAHVFRQQGRLFLSAERGRPEVGHEIRHQVDVRAVGESYRLQVARTRPARYHVVCDGVAVDVDVERSGRFERRLRVGGQTFGVLSVVQGSDYLVEVDGAVHRIAGGEAGLVRAPAPAMVVSVPVAPGHQVAEGDVVAVVESMKLETALRAPVAGTVAEVLVDANTQVEGGRRLVRLEPDPESGAGAETASGERADFRALVGDDATRAPDARTRAMESLASLRALVLGFDLDEGDAKPLLDALDEARASVGDDPGVLAAETGLLQIVADLATLSRNRRMADGTPATDDSAVDAESTRNPQEYFYAYLRSRDADAEVLPESFRIKLRKALTHYGVTSLDAGADDSDLGPALYRMFLAHRRAGAHVPVVAGLLRWRRRHPATLTAAANPERDQYRDVLDRVVAATQLRQPEVGDLARQVRFRCFDAPLIDEERRAVQEHVRGELDRLSTDPDVRRSQIDEIVASDEPILGVFAERHHAVMLEVMTRRYYGLIRPLSDVRVREDGERPVLTAEYRHDGRTYAVVATTATGGEDTTGGAALPAPVSADLQRILDALPADRTVLVDVYITSDTPAEARDRTEADARAALIGGRIGSVPPTIARVTVGVRRRSSDDLGHGTEWFTFRPDGQGRVAEDATLRGLHPMVAERLGLWRLADFDLERLPAPSDVHLFCARGRNVPEDQRLVAMADVRDLTTLRDEDGRIRSLPQVEQVLDTCLDALRSARTADPALGKLSWNRVLLYVWPVVDVPLVDLDEVVRLLAPRTEGLGLEQIMVRFRYADPNAPGQAPQELMLRMSRPPGAGLTLRVTEPPTHPMGELDGYTQKVIKAQRRGALYPYELLDLVVRNPDPDGSPGTFTEYDLDEGGAPVPVERPAGSNTANFVLGLVSTPTHRHPEGLNRVVLLGDPTRALGAIAEPECRRVLAAIKLARERSLPVEWYAVSAGAKIAMDSGTENMDWISRVLRAIIRFTQDGGEINVVVTGINVGAQPYWNAEATMLMHTRGVLVMTPDSAMVLTGKQSLDYSGGVSAEDNYGIGGYDRIMGPNGEAQYWAPDLSGAVDVLLAHYAHTYVVPGERFPRAVETRDPDDRDVRDAPHTGPDTTFTRLGEIFDAGVNGERKKPFDIRSLMRGVADADHEPLERWADMQAAESVVVLDAHLGGQSVELVGIESRPLPRRGPPPVDGPSQWTAGTLFPRSSKKAARAINAASGNRPVVVLANLSGFDGSPESLRGLQLEYGAEIGRAVVNFDGPIVFCVVSRYHGGAFVVFSATLNDNMEVAAVEGSYASVIGGAPAAAVVFAGDVNKRTAADPRVAELEAHIAEARSEGTDTTELRGQLASVRPVVRSEKLGEVADEFDARHSIARAQQMGSVHTIVDPARLRSYLIDAVRRGVERTLSGEVAPDPYAEL